MQIIQNYTLKKNVVKKILPLVTALLQGIKNLFGPLLMTWTARATAFHFPGSSGTTCTRTSFKNSIADFPTRRYGESAIFFGLTVVINERILSSLQ
jgi:hypothetical protein